jgi:hypothetical protein
MIPRKFTATAIGKLFPRSPAWQSDVSMHGNCRILGDWLRSKGVVIIRSGEAKGSPWWLVEWDEDLRRRLR